MSQRPEPSSAQDERARTTFLAGRAAYDRGHYQEALTHFNEAFELSGRAALLYNIALVEDRLRLDQDALGHYQSYLEASPDAPERAHVQTRIRILREHRARDEELLEEAVRRAQESTEARLQEATRDEPRPLRRNPWFWISLSVAVVVGGSVAVVLATRERDTLPPATGSDGTTVFALTFGR